jgi:hypothetical protein
MIQNEGTLTDNQPDQPSASEPSPPDDMSSAPDPVRPPSPFEEWTHLSQPGPAPAPPPAAAPPPVGQPPQIRPPVQPGPPPAGQDPAADRAFHRPPLGYPAPAIPLPLFPPAPPGLYPTPEDPLVSATFSG